MRYIGCQEGERRVTVSPPAPHRGAYTTYARPRPVPLASVPGPSESKASAVARVPRTSGASGASGDDRGGGSKRGGTRRLRDRMAVGDRTAAGLLGAWA